MNPAANGAKQMTISASVIFRPCAPPETFTFHSAAPCGQSSWRSRGKAQFTGHTWRFLAENCAVELSPVAELRPSEDHVTDVAPVERPTDNPPPCTRIEIHPVTWAYPTQGAIFW